MARSIVPGAGEDGAAAGVFAGTVRTENNGGFVSIRTRDYDPPFDLSASDGLERCVLWGPLTLTAPVTNGSRVPV